MMKLSKQTQTHTSLNDDEVKVSQKALAAGTRGFVRRAVHI